MLARALLAALVAAGAPAALAAPAFAAGKSGDVNMGLDEVHTLTFAHPVSTVYVGNPAIADINMIDARHAFVQGKGYGTTNIVALNSNNVQVFTAQITVTGSQNGGTVILNRGAQRITLSCAGQRCEPTPMPGDGKDAYDPASTAAGVHQTAARQAAAADAGAH